MLEFSPQESSPQGPEENEGFGHVVVLQKEALLKLNINNMGA